MATLERTVRTAAVAVALLFIGLSLCGILGVWVADRRATEAVQKVFGFVETAAKVVDAGVAQAEDLIATSRTEVRHAAETVAAVGARAQANSPVLKALNDRVETNLAPRIARMQQALTPVRDAVGAVGNVVTLLNSWPMMADRAPRLERLDEIFHRLEGLSADITQLRGTLRALASEQKNDVTSETVATLKGLAQRIDDHLSEVQAGVQEVRADVDALQVRLETRKERMLFVFNLLALLTTLMLAWILYSQTVVIRHYRR